MKLRTYNKVFQIQGVLHKIGPLPLPFPISFRQLGFGAAALVLVLILDQFPPLSLIQWGALKYFGIPVFVAWFMTEKTLDGKQPHRYLLSTIRFQINPKIFSRYQAIPDQKEMKYGGVVSYRQRSRLKKY